MPWPLISLRDRRRQVRDDIAAHLPGADASVANSVLRVVADAQAALTHDNDLHLDWLARQMMPDTAEAEFLERWANIWLPQGRKGATASKGFITVAGSIGAAVPTGAELAATVLTADGTPESVTYRVLEGVVLTSSTALVQVEAITAGAITNLDEGAMLAFAVLPDSVDGEAVVAAPGLAGGADIEPDAELTARMIARIQAPPHGGARHDYVAWALEVPGVTRAWCTQEMGAGTVTVRFMCDAIRASSKGIPELEDVALVADYINYHRPVTAADCFVVAPVPQPLDLTLGDLAGSTAEVRAAIDTEIAAMLAVRAAPGAKVWESWIGEAISLATGEDRHTLSIGNVQPYSPGHIVVPGTVTVA